MPIVTLDSGTEIEVRRLGIFELDQFQPGFSSPFTYKMKVISGEEYDAVFDYTRYKEPPVKPEVVGIPEENTEEWYSLQEWQLYTAAVEHDRQQRINRRQFYISIIKYILQTCVSEEHFKLIESMEDWERVYRAALCPQLYKEHIEKQLRETFRARFGDQEIFEALKTISGGMGVYDAIRLWENKVMLQLQMTEEEYAVIPLDERARKVCALILDNMLTALETDRQNKEREASSKRGKNAGKNRRK